MKFSDLVDDDYVVFDQPKLIKEEPIVDPITQPKSKTNQIEQKIFQRN